MNNLFDVFLHDGGESLLVFSHLVVVIRIFVEHFDEFFIVGNDDHKEGFVCLSLFDQIGEEPG